MSRSAVAAFAVMVAAGFAGCATIARSEPPPRQIEAVAAPPPPGVIMPAATHH